MTKAQRAQVIIAEILDLPADTHPRLLEWGHSGPPLLDIGIGWRTYRRAIDGLRDADHDLRERFRQLRAGQPNNNPFSRLAADGTLTDHEFTANAALLIGALRDHREPDRQRHRHAAATPRTAGTVTR